MNCTSHLYILHCKLQRIEITQIEMLTKNFFEHNEKKKLRINFDSFVSFCHRSDGGEQQVGVFFSLHIILIRFDCEVLGYIDEIYTFY